MPVAPVLGLTVQGAHPFHRTEPAHVTFFKDAKKTASQRLLELAISLLRVRCHDQPASLLDVFTTGLFLLIIFFLFAGMVFFFFVFGTVFSFSFYIGTVLFIFSFLLNA